MHLSIPYTIAISQSLHSTRHLSLTYFKINRNEYKFTCQEKKITYNFIIVNCNGIILRFVAILGPYEKAKSIKICAKKRAHLRDEMYRRADAWWLMSK